MIGHSLGHEQSHSCMFMIGHSLGHEQTHARMFMVGHRHCHAPIIVRMESSIKKFTRHCACRYIDAYMLHHISPDMAEVAGADLGETGALKAVMQTLAELRDDGVIRALLHDTASHF